MLNLTRLRMLQELSVLGTISAVADAMSLTRPAVSQQLALLERETGLILFERSVRGVALTGAGQRLVARAETLFALVNDIEAELALSAEAVSGEIRIAAFGSVGSTIVPDAIAILLKAHPGLEIVFTEMEPSEGLKAAAAKKVDIAVVDDLTPVAPFTASLDFRPLCVDKFAVVLSTDHRLAGRDRRGIALRDLEDEHWALNDLAVTYQNFVASECYAAGFNPKIRCSCRNIAGTLEFVRSGHFISVLPYLALRHIVDDPDFRIFALKPGLSRQIFLSLPKGISRRPAVAVALDALERVGKRIHGELERASLKREVSALGTEKEASANSK